MSNAAPAFRGLDAIELEDAQIGVVAARGGVDPENSVRSRVLPATISANFLGRLAPEAGAGLDVVAARGIEAILRVEGETLEDPVAFVIPLVQFAVRVVLQVEDARSGGLGEAWPGGIGGLVERPAHAGEPGAEESAGSDLRAVVAVVLTDEALRVGRVVIERESRKGVFAARVQLALRVLEAVAVGLEFKG